MVHLRVNTVMKKEFVLLLRVGSMRIPVLLTAIFNLSMEDRKLIISLNLFGATVPRSDVELHATRKTVWTTFSLHAIMLLEMFWHGLYICNPVRLDQDAQLEPIQPIQEYVALVNHSIQITCGQDKPVISEVKFHDSTKYWFNIFLCSIFFFFFVFCKQIYTLVILRYS